MAKRVAEALEPPHSSKEELTAGAVTSLLEAFQSIRIPLAPDTRLVAAEQHRRKVKRLIDHTITDERWRELMYRASEAAERGEHEYLLLRFPSDACTDRGRAITGHESNWPKTLSGDAAAVYRHWHEELMPRGFELSARILEFPGGTPGDVGLFLRWQE